MKCFSMKLVTTAMHQAPQDYTRHVFWTSTIFLIDGPELQKESVTSDDGQDARTPQTYKIHIRFYQ